MRLWSTVAKNPGMPGASSPQPFSRASGGIGGAIAGVSMVAIRLLLQALQVCDDDVQVARRERLRRHLVAGLDRLRVSDPARQVTGVVRDRRGAEGLTLPDVGEVWTDLALRLRVLDRVTPRARGVHEDALPARLLLGEVPWRQDALARGPAPEVARRLRDHEELHVRVLRAAVLRAQAAVRARLAHRDVQVVVLPGDRVDLP